MENKFVKALTELRGGRSLVELEERLAEVVEAVRRTGKPGGLRIILKLKPASKGNGEVLTAEDSITSLIPEMERGATIFYAADGGLLSRNDPRQLTLDDVKKPNPTDGPRGVAPLRKAE